MHEKKIFGCARAKGSPVRASVYDRSRVCAGGLYRKSCTERDRAEKGMDPFDV